MTTALVAEPVQAGRRDMGGCSLLAAECHICDEAIDYPLSPVFLDQYYTCLLDE